MTRFTLLLLASAVAFAQQSSVRNPHATAADVAAGSKIFRSHCAQCHGAKGEGGLGPNISSGVFYHGGTDADIFRNITDGIPGTAMPSTFFDGAQAWQIVAYVRSLSPKTAAAAPPGDAHHGEALFQEKGCAGCHLVNGEGGLRGPDLSYIGSQRSTPYLRDALLDPNANVPREYWVARIALHNGTKHTGYILNEDTHMVQLLDFSHGLQSLPRSDFTSFEVDRKSPMPSYRDRLTAQELNDLVKYLWTLKRQGGSE